MTPHSDTHDDMASSIVDISTHDTKRPDVEIAMERLAQKLKGIQLVFKEFEKFVHALAPRIDGSALDEDILRLVFRHLPLADVLAASRVSRRWRATALDTSDLWTAVDLYAAPALMPGEEYDSDDEDSMPICTNFGIIPQIIKHSKGNELTLNVSILFPNVPHRVLDQLDNVLGLVATQLVAFTLNTADSWFVGSYFRELAMHFPVLRTMAVYWLGVRYGDALRGPIDFDNMKMPALLSLSLPLSFKLLTPQRLQSLRTFVGGIDSLLEMEALISSATGLQSITLDLQPDELVPAPGDSLDYLLSGLAAIPEVHICTVLQPRAAGDILEIFEDFDGPSLTLEFDLRYDPDEFELWKCTWMNNATRLDIRGYPQALTLAFTDGNTGRTATIQLHERPMPGGIPSRGIRLDWDLVRSLDALAELHVDSAAWWRVMNGFPDAPQLQNTILRIADAASLDVMLGYEYVDEEGRPFRLCPLPTWLPDVPAGSDLTLLSPMPIVISEHKATELLTCLNIDTAFLDDVSVPAPQGRDD